VVWKSYKRFNILLNVCYFLNKLKNNIRKLQIQSEIDGLKVFLIPKFGY